MTTRAFKHRSAGDALLSALSKESKPKASRGKRIVLLAIDVPRAVTSYDVQQLVRSKLLVNYPDQGVDVEIVADFTTAKGAKLFCKDVIVCPG